MASLDGWVDGWDRAAVDLYARFRAGEVTPDQMVEELPTVWRRRSRAGPLDDAAAWRAMVDHAGYFVWASGEAVGRRARRPLGSRRLFRGATADRRFGMSWTRNPAIARDFAVNRQPDGVDDGQVWVGVFAPTQLLAYLSDEREYLVAARRRRHRAVVPGRRRVACAPTPLGLSARTEPTGYAGRARPPPGRPARGGEVRALPPEACARHRLRCGAKPGDQL